MEQKLIDFQRQLLDKLQQVAADFAPSALWSNGKEAASPTDWRDIRMKLVEALVGRLTDPRDVVGVVNEIEAIVKGEAKAS